MKLGYFLGREEKMSVGAWYYGACWPCDVRPDRWLHRGGFNKNHKSKTLRTHRTGDMGRNNRRTSILKVA